MSVIAIAATDEDWGIGYQGRLLESIPEDMRRFRELTKYGVVVMGGKTWDTLPRKPLPDRKSVVITRQSRPGVENVAFVNLEEAKNFLRVSLESEALARQFSLAARPIFVIGGGSIYEQLLPLCNEIYLTKIYKTHENVDTYFPLLDDQEWKIDWESEIKEYNGIQYQFINYSKIDN